jgi:AAA15 family ATPase/GTPase
MIEKIKISNFKSIEELELDLGRVNVLIGENGCGKTNILEAIGFGSLGIKRKLDYELLFARRIRSNGGNLDLFFHKKTTCNF